MTTPHTLAGWTPIRLAWDGDHPSVDWCLTEGVPFTDPFFDQTVDACLRHPCRLLFRQLTSIDVLGRYAEEHPGLPPAGFVFHMSRCGSTLVAQMLAAAETNLVLSEAGPLDAVLRAGGGTDRSQWLGWMVAALGQPRHPSHRRLFVKFDAWSVVDLPVVRRAFPDVPWLFLYRDPVEVLVSHARRLGAHVIPGVLPPELVGMTAREAEACPPVEYRARVLARICEAALDHADDPRATFVDYWQLPDFVTSDLPGLWCFAVDPADTVRMRAAAGQDAKNPAVAFEADGHRKRLEAADSLRAAADRWLAPLYERLEQTRACQQPC